MAKSKDKLGKGLRALLSNIENTPTEKKQEVVNELTSIIADIPVKDIHPNPNQPRTEFNKKELLELTQSVKSYGLIQPITVRKIGDSYQIISGERRWRASKLAGLKQIPAYVRIADDEAMLELALVENIQRSNLNAVEIAISYQRLIEECEFSHEELAGRVGKERSTVSNYVRLLKLPPQIQSAIKQGDISMGHARVIIGLEDSSWQFQLFEEITKSNLSVRKTEELARAWKNSGISKKTTQKGATSSEGLTPEVMKIKDELTHLFGNKVDIARNKKGAGKITIHFTNDDQFNGILDAIKE